MSQQEDTTSAVQATDTSLASKADLPLLDLEHARKSFEEVEVLKDISIQVSRGEVVAVIGPSGGGKSTLLRCCTLLETLDGGSLAFGDLQVATDQDGCAVYGGKATLRQAKQHFGLVFQNFNLFPHYTALRNVADSLISVQKMPKAQANERARELLDKMGLAGKEDMVPCDLSGGQQQRVAIARALAPSPDILFFDEPTSALDPELTQEVLRVIRDLAAEHMTMVIVTHEMGFAHDVADRIIFMDEGVIVEEGAAAHLIDDPDNARTREFLATYEQD